MQQQSQRALDFDICFRLQSKFTKMLFQHVGRAIYFITRANGKLHATQ